MSNNVVLFLGSGATAGSGIRVKGELLPTDSGFFSSSRVIERLNSDPTPYPALKLCREQLKGFSDDESLCGTWSQLFIFRGLVQAGVIRLDRELAQSFRALTNNDWPNGYRFQQRHYQHQFEVMDCHPWEYFLAELAIWDLRVLVKQMYEKAVAAPNVYKPLVDGIKPRVSALVNLNYDTTCDDALRSDRWYYPGDGRSRNRRIAMIRPHGSLKWTSTGQFSVSDKKWEGWRETRQSIPSSKMGYRRAKQSCRLELKQPLIVPPPSFKEEVVGNSSMPGLQCEILKQQWIAMEEALRDAAHWIFIGCSFASGDDHLLLLLKLCFNGQKKIHCSVYGGDRTLVDRLSRSLESHSTLCTCPHPIEVGQTILCFLNKKCEVAL